MCFRSIGIETRPEESSSHGCSDLVVQLGDQVFIIEFKMAERAEDAEVALEAAFVQMRSRGYAEKYRRSGSKVHLTAVACGREARNLLEVRAEPDSTV